MIRDHVRIGSIVCISLFGVAICNPLSGKNPTIVNGDFRQWENGRPVGWTIEIGAKTGADQPVSTVRQIAGPALAVSGNEATKAWRSVSQTVDVRPGASYRLRFKARSKGIKKEGRQYNNCYVGWFSLDGSEKVIGHEVEDLSAETTDWKEFSTDYTVPAGAKRTTVTIFLSKTGLLGVKGVSVESLGKSGDAGVDISAENNLLTNGSFRDWEGGKPSDWEVDIGASNGADAPLSEIKPIGDAGLQLSGSARTLAWQALSQDIKTKAGATYLATFQASAKKIARQGRQFDNCYVGVFHFDDYGKRLAMNIEDLSSVGEWKPITMSFTTPPRTAKSSVMIFLSKSGTLMVKDLVVTEAARRRPFR